MLNIFIDPQRAYQDVENDKGFAYNDYLELCVANMLHAMCNINGDTIPKPVLTEGNTLSHDFSIDKCRFEMKTSGKKVIPIEIQDKNGNASGLMTSRSNCWIYFTAGSCKGEGPNKWLDCWKVRLAFQTDLHQYAKSVLVDPKQSEKILNIGESQVVQADPKELPHVWLGDIIAGKTFNCDNMIDAFYKRNSDALNLLPLIVTNPELTEKLIRQKKIC